MALWHLEGSLDETNIAKKIPITKFPFVVGRNKSLDMVVLRSGISREHAEIINKDGRLYIRDLQSTNGTFVNKQRINTDVLLTHETVIHFASFEFVLIDAHHKSTDDEMLTVVMNVDEVLGLNQIPQKSPPKKEASPNKGKAKTPQASQESSSNNVNINASIDINASDDIVATEKPSSQSAAHNPPPTKSTPPQSEDDKILVQGSWDQSNRRMHARREVRWPAIVTLKKRVCVQCVTKDISEEGISLKCPVNIEDNSLIKVNINVFYKGKTRDITLLGIVKHSLITTGGFIVGIYIKSSSKSSGDFIEKFSNRLI